jgi:SAM-dependent methyltransferase
MRASLEKVRKDFDRIAQLGGSDSEPLAIYDAFLLEQIPRSFGHILEVGCGTGAFSRALADRGHSVCAMDLSPEMVRVARARTVAGQKVTYLCGDFLALTFGGRTYDCVVSIATLHHLSVDEAVVRLASLVRPGGLLVLHDIRSDAGVWDRLRSVLAVAARAGARLRRGQVRERADVRAAWDEHGRDERYQTMPEVATWCRAHLPGARTVRHLQCGIQLCGASRARHNYGLQRSARSRVGRLQSGPLRAPAEPSR